MARIRVGPGAPPSRESPEAAVAALAEAGHDACELDFGSGFWMNYPFAERLGEAARDANMSLAAFDRPATVISESPDDASTRMIGAVLRGRRHRA